MDMPTAIVTGAGSGIGRATAVSLASRGYAVALVGRTEARLQDTAAMIADGDRVLVQPANVTDPAACQAAIDMTLRRFGRLDALCNVAGLAASATIPLTTDEIWRAMIETNLSAVFYLTRAAWPVFGKQRSGIVVNVSSMASLDPFPGLGAYAAAKAAVNMLTRVTASEGAAIGVRAVTVAPGAVETPMLRGLYDELAIPPHAALDPVTVAELICDCATGTRDFTSGAVIPISP